MFKNNAIFLSIEFVSPYTCSRPLQKSLGLHGCCFVRPHHGAMGSSCSRILRTHLDDCRRSYLPQSVCTRLPLVYRSFSQVYRRRSVSERGKTKNNPCCIRGKGCLAFISKTCITLSSCPYLWLGFLSLGFTASSVRPKYLEGQHGFRGN